MINYPYTSRAYITDVYGLNLSTISDAALAAIINEIGARINILTDQWFVPIAKTLYADGNTDVLIRVPGMIPAIELSEVMVLSDRTTYRDTPIGGTRLFYNRRYDYSIGIVGADTALVQGDDYVIKTDLGSRVIESLCGGFPGGANNVKMTGVFGYLDNIKHLDIVTSANITNASTSVTLVSAEGVDVADIIPIGGRNVLINSVDYATNTITFDKTTWVSSTIPSGTTFTLYGSVPSGIQTVATWMVKEHFTNNSALGVGASPVPAGPVKRERTDYYDITFVDSNPVNRSVFKVAPVISDPVMAQILLQYTAPSIADFA